MKLCNLELTSIGSSRYAHLSPKKDSRRAETTRKCNECLGPRKSLVIFDPSYYWPVPDNLDLRCLIPLNVGSA